MILGNVFGENHARSSSQRPDYKSSEKRLYKILKEY